MYICSSMQLTTVPRNIPHSIRMLDLSGNSIQIIRNNSFNSLYNLSSLKLDTNNIYDIERDAFVGLNSLRTLKLDHNALSSISDGLFHPLVSLRRLIIDHNGIEADTLKTHVTKLVLLQELSMDFRSSFEFPSLTRLNSLSVFGIGSQVNFTKGTFKQLDIAPISNLYLDGVTSIEMDTLRPLWRLTDLHIYIGYEASKNSIYEIFKSFTVFRGRNMSNIELYHNAYKNTFTLGRVHFKYVENICLRGLTLDSMNIKYVNNWAFQLFSMRAKCLEYLALTNNVIFDEGGDVLRSNIRNFKRLRVFRFNLYADIVRYKRSNRFSSASNVTFVLTKTLEELYVGHSMRLPSPPNIRFINGLNLHVFSAPNNYVSDCKMYFMGVENLKYLDISGWTCKQLSEKLLSGFPNLETFIARGSFLGIGFRNNPKTPSLFSNNNRLQTIDLSNNSITVIPEDLFEQPFQNLKQVNLSSNMIINLPKFNSNIKCKINIDLSYNFLSGFTDKELKMVSEMETVTFYLRGNPLQCSCTTLNFMKWVNSTGRVIDYEHINCILENESRKSMSEILSNLHSFEIRCEEKMWLVFSLILSSAVLVSIVFTIIFVRYKFAIEYFLLKWKMWWNGYKPLKHDYTYDAFVSYSHHDSSWVKLFHDKLNDMGFHLCLDVKDFICGADNVMNAIDSSRKVIFIITWNFLKSDWGSFEMEMIRMHAFQDDRDEMVIIVCKDNIKRDEMPRILKNMWHKIICIQWPEDDSNIPYQTEEIFFEKISRALKRNTADIGKYNIEYLLLKWKMWWNGYKPLKHDYTFDAFVSHSHHDSIWVKVFHDKLNDMGFRLCPDAKDFTGGKVIAEKLINAIDSSRKVIFIITWNFLQSDWGSFEMEMTRMHAFQDCREEMVIIVIKDNIKPEEMPSILKRMWYKVTCIQWPEDDNNRPFHTKEVFYEKMKHALKGNIAEENIVDRNVCV